MSDMILIQAGDLDPVGKPAFHVVNGMTSRTTLGVVEKVYRFGEVDGMKASPAEPMIRVSGAVYPASELMIGLAGVLHQVGDASLLGDSDDAGHAAGD